MLKQRAKYFFNGWQSGSILLIIAMLASLMPVSAQNKETKHRVIVLHKNGKLKEKGQTGNKKKTGIWNYYTEMGRHEHKEKWKDGEMRWAIYYTPKHRKAKTINSKGDTTYLKDCGCAP
jgi:antitoxin component YwqK of YwqJK toxin-antitoxin module